MAGHLYGYGGSDLSSAYASRLTASGSISDPYNSDTTHLPSSRYLTSDSRYGVLDKASMFADGLRYAGSDILGIENYTASSALPSLYSQSSWSRLDNHGVFPPPGVDPAAWSLKRASEALYHENVLGTHNSIAQSEALFSTNPLTKRPRIESASGLPIYPQRPGEKDCAHYMSTRTCKFGDSCKFDHPLWVPEGGIPDWKEIPLNSTELLPEKPGEPDCPYFLKTQKCKYGLRCKFNHPKDKMEASVLSSVEAADKTLLPERPSEPTCAYYMKTGTCRFGANCKFHHPKDYIVVGNDLNVDESESAAAATVDQTDKGVKPFVPVTPALMYNSKGLPMRPGEADCSFYLKTGSCKYSTTCRFNHPDRKAINPPAATLTQAIINSSVPSGVVNPVVTVPQANLDPWLARTVMNLGASIYPQRPGQVECDYYMKTGECKFGERCRFHHPIDRTAPSVTKAAQAPVRLTLAGLPRREGETVCAFYMKTGACKYGAACVFDHPPPGEVVAKAVATQVEAYNEERNVNDANEKEESD